MVNNHQQKKMYVVLYGIDSVWGLGDKIQSSSWLLEKYLNTWIQIKLVEKYPNDFELVKNDCIGYNKKILQRRCWVRKLVKYIGNNINKRISKR